MPLPDHDVATIEAWCGARVPEHLRDEIKVAADVAARHVTIVEESRPQDGVGAPNRLPVARLRWTQSRGTWSLYWPDHNLEFREYNEVRPTAHVQRLLDHLETDPHSIFWG